MNDRIVFLFRQGPTGKRDLDINAWKKESYNNDHDCKCDALDDKENAASRTSTEEINMNEQ
ncbi:hypothetical protein CVT26_015766 [Gymnopilus dilepis]|uniref:Uncharacterized protein n=1 Tax=Gymnopilus dilepis TaxID=231916 RepID=A0A409VFN2_9AGAR|nr:hypothetical protein CVT26_015766 [Gymnopilus dilepis]